MAQKTEWPYIVRDDWDRHAANLVIALLNLRDRPEDIKNLNEWLLDTTAGRWDIQPQ